MTEALGEPLQHRLLTRINRRQAHVAALPGDRHPAARRRGKKPRHAEPGARPQHRPRRASHRLATTHPMQFVRAQRRQAQRQRGEIVDHHEALQAHLGLQGGDGELPRMVGHLHPVAGDGGGDAEGARARRRMVVQGQVVAHGHLDARMPIGGQRGHIADRRTGLGLPGETRVGATDVAEQTWKGGEHRQPICRRIDPHRSAGPVSRSMTTAAPPPHQPAATTVHGDAAPGSTTVHRLHP